MNILYVFMIFTTVIADGADYTNQGADWGDTDAECNASEQSPIDIKPKDAEKSKCDDRSLLVEFEDTIVTADVGNAASAFKTELDTATLKLQKGNHLATYELLQFHVHAPSEHTIDGNYADAEIHFVFQFVSGTRPAGDDRNITVLGFLFNKEQKKKKDEGENEFLNLWNVDKVGETTMGISLGYFKQLIENKDVNDFFYYDGSFTTPTCDEVVNWIVFEDVLPMCTAQKYLFDKFYSENDAFAGGNGNNRLIQPLNNRTVRKSKLSKCGKKLKSNLRTHPTRSTRLKKLLSSIDS